jgi:hypothetical protein
MRPCNAHAVHVLHDQAHRSGTGRSGHWRKATRFRQGSRPYTARPFRTGHLADRLNRSILRPLGFHGCESNSNSARGCPRGRRIGDLRACPHTHPSATCTVGWRDQPQRALIAQIWGIFAPRGKGADDVMVLRLTAASAVPSPTTNRTGRPFAAGMPHASAACRPRSPTRPSARRGSAQPARRPRGHVANPIATFLEAAREWCSSGVISNRCIPAAEWDVGEIHVVLQNGPEGGCLAPARHFVASPLQCVARRSLRAGRAFTPPMRIVLLSTPLPMGEGQG